MGNKGRKLKSLQVASFSQTLATKHATVLSAKKMWPRSHGGHFALTYAQGGNGMANCGITVHKHTH